MDNVAAFAAALDGLGIQIKKESTLLRLSKYCDMLLSKNKVMNLTALTEPIEVWIRHFADSLAVFAATGVLPERIIDVGCGAGFPGLPLKILSDDAQDGQTELTLLDSTGKKLDFLREVCTALEISGVSFANMRAEQAGILPKHRERYGLVVSRAVADLSVLCELCLPFVAPGGVFAPHKGARGREELGAAKNAITFLGGKLERVFEYSLEGGVSVIPVIGKDGHTPKGYPRAYAKIKKKPL